MSNIPPHYHFYFIGGNFDQARGRSTTPRARPPLAVAGSPAIPTVTATPVASPVVPSAPSVVIHDASGTTPRRPSVPLVGVGDPMGPPQVPARAPSTGRAAPGRPPLPPGEHGAVVTFSSPPPPRPRSASVFSQRGS